MNYNHGCSSGMTFRNASCSTRCVTGMLLMHGYVIFRLFQASVCIMLCRVVAVPLLLGIAGGVHSPIMV